MAQAPRSRVWLGWGEVERKVTTEKRSLQPEGPRDQTGPTVQTAVQAHRSGWVEWSLFLPGP